jgi:hypothetical protein
MIYCSELSFCFVAVPKTGTTSIEQFLTRYCTSKGVSFIKTNRSNTHLNNVEGKHASISAIKSAYSIENIITAGFVRNPWDKVVSWFNYLKLNRQSIHAIEQNMSFEDFLYSAPNFVFSQSCQYLTNDKGNVDVDFVGRFEEFDMYFRLMCELFNISGCQLKKMNSTYNDVFYSEFYNLDTAKFVEDQFKDDIRLFGYSFGK